MTQDEINAVKKAAEKMRKQESAQDEIDQGELCDVHYWQERALKAEDKLKEQNNG